MSFMRVWWSTMEVKNLLNLFARCSTALFTSQLSEGRGIPALSEEGACQLPHMALLMELRLTSRIPALTDSAWQLPITPNCGVGLQQSILSEKFQIAGGEISSSEK